MCRLYINMKITPSTNLNRPPAFTSNFREVNKKCGELLHRNTTYFFRNDLKWQPFSEHIIEKYKNQDKVNIYCHACSDGSEPYSLAMLLISKLGEKAQKFFPIIAKDKDDFFLDFARQGKVAAGISDMFRFGEELGSEYKKFISLAQEPIKIGDKMCQAIQLNNQLKEAVIFEKADILDDIKNIEKDNTILMFRNVWPYLDNPQMLATKLSQHLGDNSMCVIGDFDILKSKTVNHLLDAGFEPSDPAMFPKDALPIYYEKNPSFYERNTIKHHMSDPQFLMNTFAQKG